MCVSFSFGRDRPKSVARERTPRVSRSRANHLLCTKAEFAVLGVDFVGGKRFARCLPERGERAGTEIGLELWKLTYLPGGQFVYHPAITLLGGERALCNPQRQRGNV